MTDAHKHTVTEQEQWSAAHKQSEQLQQAEDRVKSESFKVDANLNQQLEDFMQDNDIKAGVDDIGIRKEAANSEAFAEYVLQNQGINIDLDGDGQVGEWKREMEEGANNLDTVAPEIQSPTGAAQSASHDAGLRPGELPLSKMGNEVDKKIETAKDHGSDVKQELETGKKKVEVDSKEVKGNVEGQSVDTSSRALVGAGDAIVNTVGDAAKGTLSAIGGVDILGHKKPSGGPGGLEHTRETETIEHINGEGRTLGDRDGDLSVQKVDSTPKVESTPVVQAEPSSDTDSASRAGSEKKDK